MIRPAAPIPLFNFAHRNWRLVIDNHTKPRAVNLELRTIASSNLLTKGVATKFQRAKDLLKKEGRCNERSGRAKGKEWQGRGL
jgi:hypothetical protein